MVLFRVNKSTPYGGYIWKQKQASYNVQVLRVHGIYKIRERSKVNCN